MFFGFSVFLVDFTIDLTHNLHNIEKIIQRNIDQNRKLSTTAVTEIKKIFYECTQFHIDAKQLSKTEFRRQQTK